MNQGANHCYFFSSLELFVKALSHSSALNEFLQQRLLESCHLLDNLKKEINFLILFTIHSSLYQVANRSCS